MAYKNLTIRTTSFVLLLSIIQITCSFPRAAQAQRTIPRVGFVAASRVPSSFYRVFREGLRELGYVQSVNVLLEARSGHNRSQLMNATIELVQQKVDVIVAPGGTVGAVAAAIADTPIPVVFSYSGDPIEAGFVKSLARPGRYMTGVTWLSFELVGKRLELLKESVPRISRVAVLADPKHPGEQRELQETQNSAHQLAINLLYHQLPAAADVGKVLSAAVQQEPHALLVFPDSVTLTHHKQIAQWAEVHRLPSLFGWKEYVEVGGLMSYGPVRELTLKRVAVYVDKILKGRKPMDLPVERPTKFELVINLKTAKQIGVTMPPNVLARADRVIR